MVQRFQSTFTWPSHLEPVAALLSRWECMAEEPSAFHGSQEARGTKVMCPHHRHAYLLWPGLLPLKPLCKISTAPSYHRLGTNPLTQQSLEDLEDPNSRRPSAFPAMDATACVLAPGSKFGRDLPALKTVHLWLCLPGAYCHWLLSNLRASPKCHQLREAVLDYHVVFQLAPHSESIYSRLFSAEKS